MMLIYFFEMYYSDGSLIYSASYRFLLNSILTVISSLKIQFRPDSVLYTMEINSVLI